MLNDSQAKVLITGANGGVGMALVGYLLQNGVRNIICQYRRNKAELLPILTKHDLDPETTCFQADLTKEEEVAKLREKISKHHKVGALVNLAGTTSNGMSWKLTTAQFNEVISGNLFATFLTCREFIPAMREASKGRIINTSSIVGFSGVAGASHYCAAKAGVAGFTKAIALELASKGVTANAIALGYFQYGMLNTVPGPQRDAILSKIPVGRFGTIDELGGMIRYLLSDEGAYVTGQVLHLNGGLY